MEQPACLAFGMSMYPGREKLNEDKRKAEGAGKQTGHLGHERKGRRDHSIVPIQYPSHDQGISGEVAGWLPVSVAGNPHKKTRDMPGFILNLMCCTRLLLSGLALYGVHVQPCFRLNAPLTGAE